MGLRIAASGNAAFRTPSGPACKALPRRVRSMRTRSKRLRRAARSACGLEVHLKAQAIAIISAAR